MDSYNDDLLLKCEMSTLSFFISQFTIKILET